MTDGQTQITKYKLVRNRLIIKQVTDSEHVPYAATVARLHSAVKCDLY